MEHEVASLGLGAASEETEPFASNLGLFKQLAVPGTSADGTVALV